MYIGIHVKYRLFCQILMKSEFSRQIFEEIVKVHENQSSESRTVPYERSDWHDEANRRFSHFCEKRLKRFFAFTALTVSIYNRDGMRLLRGRNRYLNKSDHASSLMG